MMYPSLMFRINGVDARAAGEKPWRTVERLMDAAERAGTHRFPRKKPIVRPQRNPLEWHANLTQLGNADGSAVDGTDVEQLTHGELQGRQQAFDAFGFIRDNTPGFGDSYIVDLAPPASRWARQPELPLALPSRQVSAARTSTSPPCSSASSKTAPTWAVRSVESRSSCPG
jgi:hypothetical protein